MKRTFWEKVGMSFAALIMWPMAYDSPSSDISKNTPQKIIKMAWKEIWFGNDKEEQK